MKPWNRCDDCGQFIAYKAFEEGRAQWRESREIADIYGGISEREYLLCPKCVEQEKAA